MHAEENKRRTIQKSDIATAVSKSDMYDFLIDIVPRETDLLKGSGHSFNIHTPSVSSSSGKQATGEAIKISGGGRGNSNLEMYDSTYAYAYHPMQIPQPSQDSSIYSPGYEQQDQFPIQIHGQLDDQYSQNT